MTFAAVWLAAAAVVVAMFVMFVAVMPTVMLHVSLVFSLLVSWMQYAACDHWHQGELMFHTPESNEPDKQTKNSAILIVVSVLLNRMVDSIFVCVSERGDAIIILHLLDGVAPNLCADRMIRNIVLNCIRNTFHLLCVHNSSTYFAFQCLAVLGVRPPLPLHFYDNLEATTPTDKIISIES